MYGLLPYPDVAAGGAMLAFPGVTVIVDRPALLLTGPGSSMI